MREIKDFPQNDEIDKIRKAILDLEKEKEWGAIVLAKNDLYSILKQRQAWLNDQS